MKLTYKLLLFFIISNYCACLVPPSQHQVFNSHSTSSNSNHFSGKYNYFFEPGEEELISGYHYVGTKNTAGAYLLRTFYPETKIHLSTTQYQSNRFKIKSGKETQWNENGDLRSSGSNVNNKKEGKWKYYISNNISSIRHYSDGKLTGTSILYYKNGNKKKITNFEKGMRHGSLIEYDSLNNIQNEYLYNNGMLTKTIIESDKSTKKENRTRPRFPGCEDISNQEERSLCSQKKMLQYLYKNLKYPANAKRYGIQGTTIIQFIVSKDGTMTQIKVINGISDELKNASINVLKSFPTWIPGTVDGVPVDVKYSLPIKFKLRSGGF